MKKALLYGLLASMFFALTFILNRSMNLGGGYWLWSASLRYLFMLPMLWLLLRKQKADRAIFQEIRAHPAIWLIWSTVGFGLFYAPLSLASCYGESWFVAATWQITIVAGVLLTPLFGGKIPVKNLLFSAVILVGIFLLQLPHLDHMESSGSLKALALILQAGVSYPLGNSLPSRVLHDPACLRNDLVQHPLLAAVLRLRVGYPWASVLRPGHSVCECGAVFRCDRHTAVL